MAEIETLATPTTGQVALNAQAISDAESDLVQLNSDILINTVAWDYYFVNAAELEIDMSENDDLLGSFTVCAGNVAEFWLKLTG